MGDLPTVGVCIPISFDILTRLSLELILINIRCEILTRLQLSQKRSEQMQCDVHSAVYKVLCAYNNLNSAMCIIKYA